jgi:hypothetical protein
MVGRLTLGDVGAQSDAEVDTLAVAFGDPCHHRDRYPARLAAARQEQQSCCRPPLTRIDTTTGHALELSDDSAASAASRFNLRYARAH